MERKQLNKKTDTKTTGAGRPTKYTPDLCDKVIEFGMLGDSKMTMASKLKVHTDTLAEWCKVHEEFSVALNMAMIHSESWHDEKAKKALDLPASAFNAGLWGKIMSARFPATYRETTNVQHGGIGGGAIPVAVSSIPVTYEGLRDFYKQFVDKSTCPILPNAISI